MASSRIEELKKQRQREIASRKSQIPYAAFFSIIAIIIYILFFRYHMRYGVFWIIGLLIGITLQRSRFCFTASFRDPIMVGSTAILKAIILSFFITTVGFAVIQYRAIEQMGTMTIENIPGQIFPVGLHTIIGAIMFGIGMVIAGGCASGTLMRIGEGFMMQVVSLIGFIIGTLLGARHFEFWDKWMISKTPTIYIPQYLGIPLTVILQLILLVFLYCVADWYGKKNNIMTVE